MAKHDKGNNAYGDSHSNDETIGRQVLNSVNPDEIKITTVPSVDGVQGTLLVLYFKIFLIIIISFILAYAVIPLSAESVNRMTQKSGMSLQQLLTDRNLALQPCDSLDTVVDASTSNADDTSDCSQENLASNFGSYSF